MNEENQKNPSKEYLKAYNHADMICNYMPHLLKGMHTPDNEPSDYTKGFMDRVRQYEMEKDASINTSWNELKNKYGDELDKLGKDSEIDIEKD
ncbi:hypothetical protein GC194_05000 [bacterium]|nr:hypothetical protein [bacterium]